jgi:orotate phosphoribosyltransferase
LLLTETELGLNIAERLLQIKAIQLKPQEPFTWASGLKSPIYCDNRLLLSYPAHRNAIINGFVEKSSAFGKFDCVAGVATAGIPHGCLLADRLELPFIYVRDQAKSHGRQNKIEGQVHQGMRVLVVEDLISTGGSSLKAVEALREAGCEVVGLLAIFSYRFEAAKQAFVNHNCKHEVLTDYAALLQAAETKGYISQSEQNSLQKWRLDPVAWSAHFTV